MKSLRWRFTLWFTLSLLAVLTVYVFITYTHLLHELRVEKWERSHPGNESWTLHGSYTDGEVADIAGELWHLSLLYALPVILIALGLGHTLARRSFVPVQELNLQLQAIGPRSLDQRINVPHADVEFREIEQNINALLDRLDTRFRQLSDFSAQVAHELRTPLTLLRLQVEEAADRIEPSLAEGLQDEMRRLSDYVDQCLLLATAEQGRLNLRPEPVALCALLHEMIDVYQLLAREQLRELVVDLATEHTVQADPRFLRQMMHNLLTNALRHGIGEIRVSVEQTATGICCRIENANDDSAPKPAAPSSPGLGLRIVQALATLQPDLEFSTQAEPDRFVAELHWTASPTSAQAAESSAK